MDFTQITESFQPWANTGVLVAIFALGAKVWLLTRRLGMQAKVEDRQGFGTLIESLEKRVEALDRDLARCRDEHMASRNEVIELRAEVNGLRRQLIAHSETVAVALGASDAVAEAGRRAVDIGSER